MNPPESLADITSHYVSRIRHDDDLFELLDTIVMLNQQELNPLVERVGRAHVSSAETLRSTTVIAPDTLDALDRDELAREAEMRHLSAEAGLQAAGAESHDTLMEINQVQLRFVRAMSATLKEIHRRHLDDTSNERSALRDVEDAIRGNIDLMREFQQVQKTYQERGMALGRRIREGMQVFTDAMNAAEPE